ncbi:DUF4345 domain-containing protein [Streptomyces sp. NPDC127178]|uniref:DUF4345 domain-containing protein n=1 Tax=unclassified Streptomyces TaxID=2593676 RepID=UPI0036271552
MPKHEEKKMSGNLRTIRVCLFLIAAIGLVRSAAQFVLGQPTTTPRLDNVHRFMAGIYFGSAVLVAWTAVTLRRREPILVCMLAGAVMAGGLGRLVSIAEVGLPRPYPLWIGYLAPELLVPLVILTAQYLEYAKRRAVTSATAHSS